MLLCKLIGITDVYLYTSLSTELAKRLQVEANSPRAQLQLPQRTLIEHKERGQRWIGQKRRIMQSERVDREEHVGCRAFDTGRDWPGGALHVGIVVEQRVSLELF